jgi:FKBP-type peptidyl-prolyl cis-trans isomerase
MGTSMVLARALGSVKRLAVVIVMVIVVTLAACKPEPQPASAFEAEPVRRLAADQLGEAGAVEGFTVAVVREGEGARAERGDFVRCHYIVLLPSGESLDSSHEGDPLLFRLGSDAAVIEGMHVGVEGMRVGELRRIAIPPELGYRNRTGVGIPADTILTFLIELVEVKKS